MLAIRGYDFEFVESLTPAALSNLSAAVTMLTDQIRAVSTVSAP
jgi:hypothetical protein